MITKIILDILSSNIIYIRQKIKEFLYFPIIPERQN